LILFENSVLRRVLGPKIDEPMEYYVIFEGFILVAIKTTVFCHVTPCRLVTSYQNFGRIHCLHIQSHIDPQDEGHTFL
jgi:hypothetical protein